MRAPWLFVLVACSSGATEPASHPKPVPPSDAAPSGLVAPGLRLPDGVTPLSYDLRLELDPDRIDFGGHVSIRVKIDASTDHIWIHADEIQIEKASYEGGPIAVLTAANAQEMLALSFGKQVSGEIVLDLEYSGHVVEELEGLFREQIGGKWFLYSQAEATYARRILPCFDEPRFKVPWRVTLIVPAGQVALANAPIASEKTIGKRREVTFAEITALPAHLLAVAVGPFAIVDIGPVGRAHVPARVVVAPADAKRAAAAKTWVPKLVDSLEQYFDSPLPLAKLDLVTIPRFFGAMENPGLITFETTALVGDPKDQIFLRRHIRFVAHELSHQWLGNSVTPAWWNDLWLAEAFATWLDDKLSSALGPLDDAVLRTQLARAHALETDREVGAKPIRRPIASNDDIEDAFDGISYEKGAAVISMFEEYVGAERWRGIVRAYIGHGGTATADDFVAAIAHVDAGVARSFAGYLDHPGVPIVDFALDCGKTARVVATPRDGASVPVCIRTTAGKRCVLASGRTPIDLRPAGARPASAGSASADGGCPAWVVGNAEGRGYYHVQWASPPSQAAPLDAAERLALGEDRAAAVVRGEVADAPKEIDELAATDPYGELAALAIAREVDRALVDDARRAPFAAHLAATFARRLTKAAIWDARSSLDVALRDAITEILPPSRFPKDTLQKARAIVDVALANGGVRSRDFALAVTLAAPAGGKQMFERIVTAAAKSTTYRDEWLDALAAFDGALAPRAVELVEDARFDHDQTWVAIGGMLARPATRVAAWRAVHAKLDRLLAALGPTDGKLLVDATASLCDRTSRDQVAAELGPKVTAILDGPQRLEHALAAIDRCIAIAAKL